MHGAARFLSDLQQRGVRVWAIDGQIRLKAPKGVVVPQDMELLRTHRDEIARLLERSASTVEDPILPRPHQIQVPLTAMQMRIWKRWHSAERPNFRRIWALTHIRGRLQIELLRKCLEVLTHRHQSLRTRFVSSNGTVFQEIDPPGTFPLKVIYLAANDPADADRQIVQHATDLATERRDLADGPLFEGTLFEVTEQSHALLLILDHMITDAASNEILLKELWTAYSHGLDEKECCLPEVSLQFADYAVWQERTKESWMAEHAQFWREHLSELPPLKVPTGDLNFESSDPTGTMLITSLNFDLSSKLREMARRERTLLVIVVLTAHIAMMSQWCRQSDWITAVVTGGRWRPELQSVVGWIANHLYLRVRVEPRDTFYQLLRKINSEYQLVQQHHDFDRVPDLMTIPLPYTAELSFNWSTQSHDPLPFAVIGTEPSQQIELRSIPYSIGRPIRFRPFYLDNGTEIRFGVEYRPDVFSRERIEWLAKKLQIFATKLTEEPHSLVSSIPMQ